MQVSRIRALRGPNLWSRHTAVEAIVSCNAADTLVAGLEQQLRRTFPAIGLIRASSPEQTLCLAHALEKITLALQVQAGCPVTFSRTTPTQEEGTYQVTVQYSEEAVGRRALALAQDLCQAAQNGSAFDVEAALAELRELDEDERLGPSTGCIVDAAVARGIPFKRMTRGSMVQLGWGSRQRRIQAAETDTTSAIAESIAQDKDLTKAVLHAAGVPVPLGRPVENLEEAWRFAQEIGLPVVVKPLDGNQGKGVTVNIVDREHFGIAYNAANKYGQVLVEKFLPGQDFRLLVVGDQVAAANKGETASVVGDGVHTVAELIELQINSDPRRGEEEDFPLDTIRLDEHTTSVLELKRQGLTADSVPDKDRTVLIMRTGNMALDVTDEVHPEVAAQAVLAARVVGLDIAGVDLVAQDISQPLAAQGGAIVEVNAGPGLLMHLKPAVGQPRPVGQAIANHLFKPTETGRIPVVGLMGDGDTTRPAKLVTWLLHLKGLYTGLACADGLFMNQRQLQSQGGMDWDNAQRLLINRSVQTAVFESDVRHLLAEGLPYDRCQVGVVTRMPKAQGLDDLYPGSDEKMPTYVRTQVDVVLPHGTAVLNAADAQVAELASYCDGSVIFYADDENNPRLASHRTEGGRVAFWRDGQLVLGEGQRESLVLSAKRPAVARLLQDGKLGTDDMLIAASVAWALDISTDLIRAGVKSFGQNTSH